MLVSETLASPFLSRKHTGGNVTNYVVYVERSDYYAIVLRFNPTKISGETVIKNVLRGLTGTCTIDTANDIV